jgi:hypothetical protein
MPSGRSLHVGLNRVDPASYGGWSGALRGCEHDATDLRDVCAWTGLATSVLLTADATADAVLAGIEDAARRLQPGDLFVLTYSGHGGQVPDLTGDEADAVDETWVLFDRQVLDDELHARWAGFAPGVRVVVVSDSCHSGTVVRVALQAAAGNPLPPIFADARAMPADVNDEDNVRRQAVYGGIRAATPRRTDVSLAARVLLLSGCRDDQTAGDGAGNGRFTAAVLRTWDSGAYQGGYRRLVTQVKRLLPPWQTPGYLALNDPRRAFATEQPFRV